MVQQVIPEIADRVPILGVNPRSFTSWERACARPARSMAALVGSTSTLTGVGEPEGLAGARISPGLFDVLGIPPMYPDAASRARFFDALLDGLRREPGVAVAGLARALPLEGLATVDAFVAAGDARPGLAQPVGSHVQVSAGYFAAIGLPLLRGRLLTPDNHARAVAVISDHTGQDVVAGRGCHRPQLSARPR